MPASSRFGARAPIGAVQPMTAPDQRPPEHPAEARWYVVHTQPSKELLAVANLRRQGFTTFLPQVSRTIRHARKVSEVLRPLFLRYVFVSLNVATDRWRAVRSTLGVSALIMEGERPKPVPRGLVEGFIAAVDGTGGFDFSRQLVVGGQVRFLKGPFADRLGRIVEMSDAERVHVLLEMLGTEREVEVDAGSLLPDSR
jgi:transcriptional antiterminator RfaH